MNTFSKTISIIFAFASLPSFANAANEKSEHPIVGQWDLVYQVNGCVEHYNFKADGTTRVTSAKEIGESRYEISDSLSSKGFYKLIDTVTKDNGEASCAGESSPVGDVATLYVKFNESGDQMIFCQSENLTQCMGPLTRVKSGSSRE